MITKFSLTPAQIVTTVEDFLKEKKEITEKQSIKLFQLTNVLYAVLVYN